MKPPAMPPPGMGAGGGLMGGGAPDGAGEDLSLTCPKCGYKGEATEFLGDSPAEAGGLPPAPPPPPGGGLSAKMSGLGGK